MSHSSVHIACPNCSHRFAVLIAELLPGNSKRCSACGRYVEFSTDDVHRGIRQAIDDMDDDRSSAGNAADVDDSDR